MEEGIITELFKLAYREAAEEGDLWWQIRPLQELGWEGELKQLLSDHSDEIRESGNPLTLALLNWSEDRQSEYVQSRKDFARGVRSMGLGRVAIPTGSETEGDEGDREPGDVDSSP